MEQAPEAAFTPGLSARVELTVTDGVALVRLDRPVMMSVFVRSSI